MTHERSTNLYLLLFFMLIVANISVYRTIFAPHELQVSVLDVGEKGSATLVHAPSGATILIDTGPDASILRALGTALPPWQRRIDAVILTSTKSSSVGGLPALLSRYHVSNKITVGDRATPYGSSLIFDNTYIKIISPATFIISYGSKVFSISSSTPKGLLK